MAVSPKRDLQNSCTIL